MTHYVEQGYHDAGYTVILAALVGYMPEDLTVFFEDFAVPATFGAATADVLLDAPTSELLGGEVLSTDFSILYRTTDLQDLVRGSSLTVDGATYRVREILQLDDGAFKRATLSNP